MVNKKDNVVLEGIKALLHGISQVLLIENVVSGAIILIAIYVASMEAGIAATIAVIIGTGTAKLLRVKEESIRAGLFGFSPVLVGIASITFLQGPNKWVIVVVGSIAATFITIFVNEVLLKWELPGLTFPFIIVTWLVLLASYGMQNLNSEVAGSLPQVMVETGAVTDWWAALSKGIGEVFLLDSIIASILIFVAIVVAGIKEGLRTVLAIAVSLGVVLISGMNLATFSLGLYSYNIILTFLAAGVFMKVTRRNVVITIFGGVLTLVFDIALSVLLAPYGIPVLTMPFVLATWIILLIAKTLDEVK